jgi:hypothetical protein
MELPHGIDWGKLEYRFEPPGRAGAYWQNVQVADAVVTDGERSRLVALLAEAVHAALDRDAATYAGAVGDPEEGLAGFAEAIGVEYKRRS